MLALPALAQTTGTLSGQVVDANSQQAVGDAVVIAQSPSLQGEQTAVTDASGAFVLAAWALGVLNSHRKFLLSYSAGIAWNIAIIIALLWFGGKEPLPELAAPGQPEVKVGEPAPPPPPEMVKASPAQ